MFRLAALFLSALIVSSFVVLSLNTVSAYEPLQDVCTGEAAQSPACKSSGTKSNPLTGPNGLLIKVTRLIAIFAAIAAVVVIIIAGYKYMLSMGAPEKASGAKNTIIYAVVGLVVILLAQYVVTLVLSRI